MKVFESDIRMKLLTEMHSLSKKGFEAIMIAISWIPRRFPLPKPALNSRSWYSKMYSWSKLGRPSLTDDQSHDTADSDEDVVITVLKPVIKEPEYNFLCGICHGYLVKPRMCPFCRYKSCEKCFNTWFEQERKDEGKIPSCPQCRDKLDINVLVHIPSLDDLDRNFSQVQNTVRQLENTFEDVVTDMTAKVEQMATDHELDIKRTCKFCSEEMRRQKSEITAAIKIINVKLVDIEKELEKSRSANREIRIAKKSLPAVLEVVDETKMKTETRSTQPQTTGARPRVERVVRNVTSTSSNTNTGTAGVSGLSGHLKCSGMTPALLKIISHRPPAVEKKQVVVPRPVPKRVSTLNDVRIASGLTRTYNTRQQIKK